jgi:predicted PurR-regulated permease PerM
VPLDRFFHRKPHAARDETASHGLEIDVSQLPGIFRAPEWLRDLGILAWFLVGVGVVLVGAVWIFAQISTIAIPVVVGGIIAAVAGPLVSWMARHRVPRAAGAAIVTLGVVALGIGILLLVLAGIVDQQDEIRAAANSALDKIEGWFNDAGADNTSSSSQAVATAVSTGGHTLLHGVADGIKGLTSLALFISFTLFSTFFLLKDGHRIRAFVDRHLGVPQAVATTITRNTIGSMRRYFLGLTIVAAFNGFVVGLGAYLLDVPLAGTIAVVTFVLAYIPFIGAFVSGAFAVILALAGQGTEVALVMLVIVLLANGLLQNIVQPVAFGATLDLNPLAVLIVTIAAGGLFGMIGMIVAAPLLSAAVHISSDLRRAKLEAVAAATAAEAVAAEAPG